MGGKSCFVHENSEKFILYVIFLNFSKLMSKEVLGIMSRDNIFKGIVDIYYFTIFSHLSWEDAKLTVGISLVLQLRVMEGCN